MKEYMHTTSEPEFAEFLDELHDIILPYYSCYMENHGFLSFEQFFEFYKDFSIFPDIINLIQLKNIFFTLSEILVKELHDKETERCTFILTNS
jgi:hypothetical protein